MRAVVVSSAAKADITEAFDWYEARAGGLGAALLGEIDRQVARIAENPLQFPIVHRDVRRARLRRFPYALLFRLVGETALIVACFHGRRDPKRWRGRV